MSRLDPAVVDAVTVRCIRLICARELGGDPDYPWFRLSYLPGEEPDEALLRIFREERRHQASAVDTVLVMCHG